MTNKIELNDLSKKLGLSKGRIVALCYTPGSTLKYEHKGNKKYFDYDKVIETIQRGR